MFFYGDYQFQIDPFSTKERKLKVLLSEIEIEIEISPLLLFITINWSKLIHGLDSEYSTFYHLIHNIYKFIKNQINLIEKKKGPQMEDYVMDRTNGEGKSQNAWTLGPFPLLWAPSSSSTSWWGHAAFP